MSTLGFSDKGSAKASDFLNFEMPSYQNYDHAASPGFKAPGGPLNPNANSTSSSSTSAGIPSGFGNSSTNTEFGNKGEENFLLKGIEFVANGASNLQSKTSSYFGWFIYTILYGNVGSLNSENVFQENSTSRFSALSGLGKSVFGLASSNWRSDSSWKTYTNYKAFLVLFATSVLFGALSFMALPFIVFAPHKFGLLFTCASISFLASMALLRGAGTLMEHLLDPSRMGFTLAYFSSLFCTLLFTTVYPLYIMAFLSSVVQSISLMSVIVSYIPGLFVSF
ncbi:bifunctional Vesicle transport protein [Babesia duncani]|uniref:Vesicle transport protein n=1 Tax=Babesia duncani TaxID=323732 RepID=A0AAD9PJS0_9APIC|nr:bifunctional Vesicle transport protein [Babesia duncani]